VFVFPTSILSVWPQELDFSWAALVAAAVANLFAAVKGNENKKLMETKGVKERCAFRNGEDGLHTESRRQGLRLEGRRM